jgi:hypothetical protein
MNDENESSVQYNSIHIHGDNIVECERAFELIKKSLEGSLKEVSGPEFSVTCPRYQLRLTEQDTPITITFYPGFGRWDHDILISIKERGGRLREAADAIVTGVNGGAENLLFAIEFCGALPAGNNAWQRNGRAYSFGAAKVPYLYISELGGFELDSDRTRKAARMPNPAVPFSFLSYSIEMCATVFPIYITAPGADEESRKKFAEVFADRELTEVVRALLLQEDHGQIFARLKSKVMSFVIKRGDEMRTDESLSGVQWQEALDSLSNEQLLPGYLVQEIRGPFAKRVTIKKLTDRAKAIIELGKRYGIGLTSKILPMCLIDSSDRRNFASEIERLYEGLDDDFLSWLSRDKHLAVCWITGFKPAGDDSRPDRGLPPLTRMLIGSDHDMMTIVYGPALETTWPILEGNPRLLAERNGLWESILETSDALLVESVTDGVSRKGYIRAHCDVPDVPPSRRSMLKQRIFDTLSV